jgi:hypothetical protein
LKLPVDPVDGFDDCSLNFEFLQTGISTLNGVTIPLTSSAWIVMTPLLNSWVNGASGEGSVAYFKDPLGMVHLRGYLTTGTSNTIAFVLPAGYRPGGATYYPSVQANGVAGSFIYVGTNGNIIPTYSTGGARLTAVHYLAEN